MGRKRNSRTARWEDAAKRAVIAKEELESALEDLKEVQSEYESWKDNLPDNMQSSAVADKLETVCAIDFDIDFGPIDEAESADLPLGFGRD